MGYRPGLARLPKHRSYKAQNKKAHIIQRAMEKAPIKLQKSLQLY